MDVATPAPQGISEHGPVGCHPTQSYATTAGNLHRNPGVDSLDELVQTQAPERNLAPFDYDHVLQILCPCPKVIKRSASGNNLRTETYYGLTLYFWWYFSHKIYSSRRIKRASSSFWFIIFLAYPMRCGAFSIYRVAVTRATHNRHRNECHQSLGSLPKFGRPNRVANQ